MAGCELLPDLTSKRLPGLAVPIPTRPDGLTRIASVPLVFTTSGRLSVVPKKLAAGSVPVLPVVSQTLLLHVPAGPQCLATSVRACTVVSPSRFTSQFGS